MANKQFDSVRNHLMDCVGVLFEGMGYDVLHTNSNEICLPIISNDESKEEGYLVVTFKVPSGSRDGEPYDGYLVAQDFADRQKAKAEKAEKAKAEKAQKIARDEKMRAEKARLKAEREKANA